MVKINSEVPFAHKVLVAAVSFVIGAVVIVTVLACTHIFTVGGVGALVMFGFPIAMLGLSFCVVLGIQCIDHIV